MRYGQRGQEARRGGAGLLEIMANKLGLTEEQKTKIKDILEKTRQEINTVGKDVRSAIAGIREKSDKQIMEILTPEQQEKFKALQKEFKKRGGFKGPRGGHRAMRGYEPCPSEELPPPQQ
jgi:Spy/CpxP family protein refolding chaperone